MELGLHVAQLQISRVTGRLVFGRFTCAVLGVNQALALIRERGLGLSRVI